MLDESLKLTIKKLNVIFIDDEANVVEAMKETLPYLFNNTYYAVDGHEGLEIIKNNNIDLVITDLSMPKMNGIEMLSLLEEIKPSVKSICVSGHNEIEYVEKMQKFQCELIIKPITLNALYKALETIYK